MYGAEPVSADLIRKQLQCLADDSPIHAIKTGALGNAAVVDVLVDFIREHPGIPVITDPVIKAAGGGDLADDELVSAMKEKLFPVAEMITPNGVELAMLGNSEDADQAADNLLKGGCESVLATGGHGTGIHIINTLYSHAPEPMGCPLAAAISAGRASGLSPRAAISQAQNYVHRAILHALEVGKGQPVPDRGILWER